LVMVLPLRAFLIMFLHLANKVGGEPSHAAVLAHRADNAFVKQRWGDAVLAHRGSLLARRGKPAVSDFTSWVGQPGTGQPQTPIEAWQADPKNGYRQVSRGVEHRGLTATHKLKHDAEQIEHLVHTGALPSSFHNASQALWAVWRELENTQNKKQALVKMSREHRQVLRGVYNRVAHLAPAHSTLPERAVQNRDFVQLEVEYLQAQPEILHLDNFLSEEALRRLRRFCVESTIWFDIKPTGYLGSYADDGFSTPLLYQIADELQQAFPHVFKGHPLVHMWAYKYDSDHDGINIHADVARVNVNFWVTEDDANLDPASGGLVVFKMQAPSNASFAEFNSVQGLERAHRMIEADGRRNVTIPYQENRMVMFNSNLWHRTDHFRFKSGYRKRRINITMLFGSR